MHELNTIANLSISVCWKSNTVKVASTLISAEHPLELLHLRWGGDFAGRGRARREMLAESFAGTCKRFENPPHLIIADLALSPALQARLDRLLSSQSELLERISEDFLREMARKQKRARAARQTQRSRQKGLPRRCAFSAALRLGRGVRGTVAERRWLGPCAQCLAAGTLHARRVLVADRPHRIPHCDRSGDLHLHRLDLSPPPKMLLHFALPVGEWSENGTRQRVRCPSSRAHLQLQEELRRPCALALQGWRLLCHCPRVPPVVRARGGRRRHAGPVRARTHAVRRGAHA